MTIEIPMSESRRPRRTGFVSRARAFTLVELLVVIGIIALLISILLPALAKARQAAMTVQDMANIRTVLQGMQMYVSESKGFFPGGPNSSGAFLLIAGAGYSNTNCPNVSQIWDWQAPIAHELGIDFPTAGDPASRWQRFSQLMEVKAFHCPTNEFLMVPYTGSYSLPGATVLPMNSYCVATSFHYKHTPGSGVPAQLGFSYMNPPDGYGPKITSVGDAARKIYIADGSRYSSATVDPDYDANYTGSQGGAYGDWGAYSSYSKSLDRAGAPGNGQNTPNVDSRARGFRHGAVNAHGAPDTFRFNAGFFDGHVETLGDLEGADPGLWTPRGTQVSASEFYPDVAARYNPAGGTYISP